MRKKISCLVAMFVALLTAGSLFVAQADAQGLKERMTARLPIITDLKSRGVIGENNKGYLEFIGGKEEKADVVKAENEDRKIVYAAIAKKAGSTLENAGERRAKVIAEKAKPGDWLQDENGKWYQKK